MQAEMSMADSKRLLALVPNAYRNSIPSSRETQVGNLNSIIRDDERSFTVAAYATRPLRLAVIIPCYTVTRARQEAKRLRYRDISSIHSVLDQSGGDSDIGNREPIG